MNENKSEVVVISPLTKIRLEEIKLDKKKSGIRSTLGGIVDSLVEYEYKRIKD